MVTRVKICGLTRITDVELAIELGADALGFVFEPTSPRFIGDDKALIDFASSLTGFATTVAVFGLCEHEPVGFDRVQYVEASFTPARPLPVLRLGERTQLSEALRNLEAILTDHVVIDSYHPHAFGGTGERVNWHLVAELAERSAKKIILAGGLNPDNVARAIEVVKPYAVDVSSGVESSAGVKDEGALRAFLNARSR